MKIELDLSRVPKDIVDSIYFSLDTDHIEVDVRPFLEYLERQIKEANNGD